MSNNMLGYILLLYISARVRARMSAHLGGTWQKGGLRVDAKNCARTRVLWVGGWVGGSVGDCECVRVCVCVYACTCV